MNPLLPKIDGVQATALLAALRQAGLVNSSEPRLRELKGGVSSELYLVEDSGRCFVVKRALPKLHVAEDWFADPGRNRVEQHFFAYAAAFAPDALPKVLGGDPGQGWFAMEYFGSEYEPWKAALMRGEADVKTAERAGHILGLLHEASWLEPTARARFATLRNFEQLRIEPYLRTTAERVPAVRNELLAEAERLSETRLALVHGDYSPKNLLAGAGRVVVLDAECGWFGDPAFDAAFLLNHLFLKALLHAERPEAILALVPAFWSSYLAQMGVLAGDALERRTTRLLLCLMLARVEGKSPVEYLTSAQRRFTLGFAVPMLASAPHGLEEIMQAWRASLKRP
jgi:aminoglycoside phosphotransferase (APT) family kinase protein